MKTPHIPDEKPATAGDVRAIIANHSRLFKNGETWREYADKWITPQNLLIIIMAGFTIGGRVQKVQADISEALDSNARLMVEIGTLNKTVARQQEAVESQRAVIESQRTMFATKADLAKAAIIADDRMRLTVTRREFQEFQRSVLPALQRIEHNVGKIDGFSMMLTVQREPTLDGATLGSLYLSGAWFCFTVEDRIREVPGAPVESWKVPGQTAIPSGRYPLRLSLSSRFQRVLPEVLDVPGFTGIRIHSGNSIAETEGCLLVGTGRAWNRVTGSRVALEKLLTVLPDDEAHTIEFRNPYAWGRLYEPDRDNRGTA